MLRGPWLSPGAGPERQHHGPSLFRAGNGQGIRPEKAEDIVLSGTDADVVLRAQTSCQLASTNTPSQLRTSHYGRGAEEPASAHPERVEKRRVQPVIAGKMRQEEGRHGERRRLVARAEH